MGKRWFSGLRRVGLGLMGRCIALGMAAALGSAALAGEPIRVELQPSRVKPIHQFTLAEGDTPFRTLVRGPDDRLYGVSWTGGPSGLGTFFRMSVHGHVVVQHAFGPGDGVAGPDALILGADGNFYAIAMQLDNGKAALIRLTPHGKLTVVYRSLDYGSDCLSTYARLMQGRDGHFYVIDPGGLSQYGCIVRVTVHGHVSVRHRFNDDDGSYPQALVESADGDFYGVTESGGLHNAGTFFRMRRSGEIKVLHHFGAPPNSLVEASDGFFYGASSFGGAQHAGRVFRLSRQGDFTPLHDFEPSADGSHPWGGVILGHDEQLYGLTLHDGKHGAGTAFRLSRDGAFTVLHALDRLAERSATAGLAEVADGRFYWVSWTGTDPTVAYQLRVVP